MSAPIASLSQFLAVILAAVEALGGLIPVKDAIESLVGAATRSPHLPTKSDGSAYSDDELIALVYDAAARAKAAWHVGDTSGQPSPGSVPAS